MKITQKRLPGTANCGFEKDPKIRRIRKEIIQEEGRREMTFPRDYTLRTTTSIYSLRQNSVYNIQQHQQRYTRRGRIDFSALPESSSGSRLALGRGNPLLACPDSIEQSLSLFSTFLSFFSTASSPALFWFIVCKLKKERRGESRLDGKFPIKLVPLAFRMMDRDG